MHILALSGSLRAASINATLLRAAARLAPPGMTVEVADFIRPLPNFDPDLVDAPPAPAVAALRAALIQADGVIIACPEYAHGLPGAFKNALDWVVASGELVDKPVALFHASARSRYARAALAETLVTMNAHWVVDAGVEIPIAGTSVALADIVDHPARSREIVGALTRFAAAIRTADQVKADHGSLPLPTVRPVFPVA